MAKLMFINDFMKRIGCNDENIINEMVQGGFLIPANETEAGSLLFDKNNVSEFDLNYANYCFAKQNQFNSQSATLRQTQYFPQQPFYPQQNFPQPNYPNGITINIGLPQAYPQQPYPFQPQPYPQAMPERITTEFNAKKMSLEEKPKEKLMCVESKVVDEESKVVKEEIIVEEENTEEVVVKNNEKEEIIEEPIEQEDNKTTEPEVSDTVKDNKEDIEFQKLVTIKTATTSSKLDEYVDKKFNIWNKKLFDNYICNLDKENSIIVCKIDNIETVKNEGNDFLDYVKRKIIDIIKENIENNLIPIYTDDYFIINVFGSEDDAFQFAEKCRCGVASVLIKHNITVSLSIVSRKNKEPQQKVLEKALAKFEKDLTNKTYFKPVEKPKTDSDYISSVKNRKKINEKEFNQLKKKKEKEMKEFSNTLSSLTPNTSKEKTETKNTVIDEF